MKTLLKYFILFLLLISNIHLHAKNLIIRGYGVYKDNNPKDSELKYARAKIDAKNNAEHSLFLLYKKSSLNFKDFTGFLESHNFEILKPINKYYKRLSSKLIEYKYVIDSSKLINRKNFLKVNFAICYNKKLNLNDSNSVNDYLSFTLDQIYAVLKKDLKNRLNITSNEVYFNYFYINAPLGKPLVKGYIEYRINYQFMR